MEASRDWRECRRAKAAGTIDAQKSLLGSETRLELVDVPYRSCSTRRLTRNVRMETLGCWRFYRKVPQGVSSRPRVRRVSPGRPHATTFVRSRPLTGVPLAKVSESLAHPDLGAMWPQRFHNVGGSGRLSLQGAWFTWVVGERCSAASNRRAQAGIWRGSAGRPSRSAASVHRRRRIPRRVQASRGHRLRRRRLQQARLARGPCRPTRIQPRSHLVRAPAQ